MLPLLWQAAAAACAAAALALASPDPLGYSNGTECWNGECKHYPTLAERIFCCSTRCPQWTGECVDKALEEQGEAAMFEELSGASMTIASGKASEDVVIVKADFMLACTESKNERLNKAATALCEQTPLVRAMLKPL